MVRQWNQVRSLHSNVTRHESTLESCFINTWLQLLNMAFYANERKTNTTKLLVRELVQIVVGSLQLSRTNATLVSLATSMLRSILPGAHSHRQLARNSAPYCTMSSPLQPLQAASLMARL